LRAAGSIVPVLVLTAVALGCVVSASPDKAATSPTGLVYSKHGFTLEHPTESIVSDLGYLTWQPDDCSGVVRVERSLRARRQEWTASR
jgi:hypothetical protein